MEQPLVGRLARTPASAACRARIAAGDVEGHAGAACAQGSPLEPAVSERLDRLLEAIGLALGVFEDPLTTETWHQAPHPLLHQVSPLQHCRTTIGTAQVGRLLQAMEQGAPV
jgi:hypothetical protein